jgi:hypothetical protein
MSWLGFRPTVLLGAMLVGAVSLTLFGTAKTSA